MKRLTIAVAGGLPHDLPVGIPVVSPLMQSVNFIHEPGTREGLLYARTGGNSGLKILEKRLALLEGTEDAAVLGSGTVSRTPFPPGSRNCEIHVGRIRRNALPCYEGWRRCRY